MKKWLLLLIIINCIICVRLYDLMVLNHDFYVSKYKDITVHKIYGKTPLRGRILDINGKVLVDNKIIKNYVYKGGYSINNLQENIKKIASILNFNKCSTRINKVKYYYYLNSDYIDSLVSNDMYNNYRLKKISKKEYLDYKYSLITDDMIKDLNDDEVIIFSKLNNNYYNDDKLIKEDLTDEEITKLSELFLDNFVIDTSYIRIFNYDTCINQLFGTVGSIPKDKYNLYINKGYLSNDLVGLSYLEYYYDDILKGKRSITYIDNDHNIVKYDEEIRGSDIVLNIDIDTQLEIENILKEEILNVKKYSSSVFYNGSFVVVSDILTGGIVSIAGYSSDLKYNSLGAIYNSYTVGSVVKAASQSVAYKYGVLDEKTLINDSCIKLYSQPLKCSYKRLGILNDINSIAYSSNYFQFINAIKVSGNDYYSNMKLNITKQDFDKYRDMFRLYGLGNKTGIDLPNEGYGLIGKIIAPDLYLNLSIGQYDGYSPLMLNQYISTIANNGDRKRLHLVNYSIDNNSKKNELNTTEVLNSIDISSYYMKRIQDSLNSVIKYGTGYSYTDNYDMAGKTGTSETVFNGYNTISRSFIAYFPYSNPRYAISIVSPNILYKNSFNSYSYPINNLLSRKISNILFEK